MTRLSSSSPVTAATTSASFTPAPSSAPTSQASASSHATPTGSFDRTWCLTTFGSLSTISTSWPAPCSCSAMNRPTLPPPAITTRTSCYLNAVRLAPWPAPCPARPGCPSSPPRTAGRPAGPPCAGVGTIALPSRPTATTLPPTLLLEVAERRGRPTLSGTARSTSDTLADGSVHSAGVSVGSSRRRTWSVVQATVATVVSRGAGRSPPAGGRRSGRRRARCRTSRGPPGRRARWSCRRWSPTASATACSMPASMSRSRSKPMPSTVWPAKSGPSRANASRTAIDDGDRVAAVEDGVGQRRPDPPAPDDDDVHAAEHSGGAVPTREP